MSRIRWVFWLYLLGLTGLWWWVDPTVWGGATFFRWRSALLQCSGVVAIGGMSLAMVLAVRPVWFESRLGDPVEVEGPYGSFTFEGTQPHQIWVGAGIGIAPFVARMKTLAHQGPGQGVDLFHTTAVLDPEVVGLLEKDARDAGVALHLFWDERDGLLTGARITTLVPEWRAAEVWFCGPSAFGAALRRDLLALGLPAVQFHQELFELR
jgi:predicted ferric reductase